MQGREDDQYATKERLRYLRAWQDLRRRLVIQSLLFFPLFLRIAWELKYPSGFSISSPLPLLWFALTIGAILWYNFFPCPRCRRPFFLTIGWRSILERKCVHCGLRRGASYEEARTEPRTDRMN